jgi:hypothetical protein
MVNDIYLGIGRIAASITWASQVAPRNRRLCAESEPPTYLILLSFLRFAGCLLIGSQVLIASRWLGLCGVGCDQAIHDLPNPFDRLRRLFRQQLFRAGRNISAEGDCPVGGMNLHRLQ